MLKVHDAQQPWPTLPATRNTEGQRWAAQRQQTQEAEIALGGSFSWQTLVTGQAQGLSPLITACGVVAAATAA